MAISASSGHLRRLPGYYHHLYTSARGVIDNRIVNATEQTWVQMPKLETYHSLSKHNYAVLPKDQNFKIDLAGRRSLSMQSLQNEEMKIKAISSILPTVEGIRRGLETNHACVLYGAPGSGKTEQMMIACGAPYSILDLKARFVDHVSQKKHMKKEEENLFWSEGYRFQKKEQLAWLKDNLVSIEEELISSKTDTIVFDEFDLSSSSELDEIEWETVKIIISLGEKLKREGKKVIFIAHQSSLQKPEFIVELKKKKIIRDEKDIVATGFLPIEAEQKILDSIGIQGQAEQELLAYTGGHPGPYLHYLKHGAKITTGQTLATYRPSTRELRNIGITNIQNCYKVIKQIEEPELVQLLQDLAQGVKTVQAPEVQENLPALIRTGLITADGMPPIVRDVIVADHTYHTFHSKTPYKAIPAEDILVINAHKPSMSYPTARAIHFAQQRGGAHYYSDLKIVIPKAPHQISLVWRQKVGEIGRITKSDEIAMRHEKFWWERWGNSADSIETLLENAELFTNDFLELFHKTSFATRAKYFMGENNKHLLKDRGSLTKKVNFLMKHNHIPEALAVKQINDSLRGSIVSETPEQQAEALRSFVQSAKQMGYEVDIDDKYLQTHNPSGYVAIHVQLLMKKGSVEHIAEVQFHLEQIYDGTEDCPKEVVHRKVYKSHALPQLEPHRTCISGLMSGALLIFTSALDTILIPESVSTYLTQKPPHQRRT